MTAKEFAQVFEPDPWNGGELLPARDSTPGCHALEIMADLYSLDRRSWKLIWDIVRAKAPKRACSAQKYHRLSMPSNFGRKLSPEFVAGRRR